MSAIITLTTDFGLADAYVAAMKGVVLGINPRAQLVDICHTVPPQDIARAAFVLGASCPYFPPATIHLIVVDPGVGTGRKAVIIRTPEADFVAPDNGVLSYVLQPYFAGSAKAKRRKFKATPGLEAVAVTEPRFWRSPVSATFHGRDIFAPVAAHLSLGVPPSEFGEPIDTLTVLPLPLPSRSKDGTLTGSIRQIDNFGNLITNIRSRDLTTNPKNIIIQVGDKTIHGLSRTYGESSGLLALIGSSDHLEISLKNGSAADFLNARAGDVVKIMGKSQQ